MRDCFVIPSEHPFVRRSDGSQLDSDLVFAFELEKIHHVDVGIGSSLLGKELHLGLDWLNRREPIPIP